MATCGEQHKASLREEQDVKLGSSESNLDRCSSEPPPTLGRRDRFRGWLLSCRRMAVAHPMVIITPLVVLGALLAVGIVGVIILSDAIENQRKDDAVNEAVARGIVIGEKLQMASVPVHGLANFVLSTPNYSWPIIQQSFNTTAQSLIDLLAGSGVGTQIQVAMAPAAIVLGILPYEPIAIHRDLLADATQRDSALLAIRSRQLTLSGPSYLKPGWLGVAVRLPVFVNGSYGPDETFGVPFNTIAPYGNTPYNCPECYGDLRFWGFCSSILDWDAIRVSTRVDDLYNESGYRFQLSRPAQGTETSDFVMAQSPDMVNQSFDDDDEYVEVLFSVLTGQWTLRLYREDGWFPSWRAPMIAVVAIIALVLSLLIGLVMGWNCRLMETTTRLEVTARKLQHEKERMDALLVRQYDLISCFARVNTPENSNSDLLGLKIDRLRNSLHSRRVSNSLKPLEGDKIELHELLGSGSFGKVYRGTWRGTTVAVKCIVLPSSMSRSAHAERMALMETAISSSMHHPHLVQTYTYSIKPIKDSSMTEHSDLLLMEPVSLCEGSAMASAAYRTPRSSDALERCHTGSFGPGAAGPGAAAAGPRLAAAVSSGAAGASLECSQDVHSFEIQLVLEFCDGSLDEFLKHSGFLSDGGLNFGGILDTAADVAKGMLHLHMNEILHSDLKAGNVMFKAGGHDGRGVIAKVVDFGLSIQLDISGNQTHVSKMFQGTLTHMAPEVLLYGKQSKAADVFAFGILMFELYTGAEPYAGTPAALLGHHVAREGCRPQFTSFTPIAYRSLAERCWQADPDLRPTFGEILDHLQAMRAAYPASAPIVLPSKPPPSHPTYSPLHESAWTQAEPTPLGPGRRPLEGPLPASLAPDFNGSSTAKVPALLRASPLLPIPEHSDKITVRDVELCPSQLGPAAAAQHGDASAPCVGVAGTAEVSLELLGVYTTSGYNTCRLTA